jgi:NAD(P)-dependent dehydrogenase (short-subunit alcohol dehydrogenase family)
VRPLKGKVAVVAGATRGAGRGVARALGEAGATVYCTGRSVRGRPSPYNRPETIEETAELVTAAGGTGIPVRVDHTVDAEVRGLFARVAAGHKRLDVLVNTVAGEDPTLGLNDVWSKADIDQGPAVMRQAVFSHLITARHAIPLMRRRRKGLIVEVTEGDTLLGFGLRGLVKQTLKMIAFSMAEKWRRYGIAVVAVTPGFLRSESMLERFGVTEDNWRDAGKKDPNFLESESPLFVGRGVAALAADPKVLARSGDLAGSWELAREYGVVDADGRRPEFDAHWEKIAPAYPSFQEAFRREALWLDKLARRAERYTGKASPKNASSGAGRAGRTGKEKHRRKR